jgi:hypothetical protein
MARDVVERLIRSARAETDPVKREALLDQAAQGIPRGLYGEVLEALKEAGPGSLEEAAARAILLRWAWQEPTGAAAWALAQPAGPVRREALGAAAARWVESQPEQVLQWSATLSSEDRQWVLLRAADRLARVDPETFIVWQQALPAGRERDQLTLQTAQLWAQRDPEMLAESLARYSAPELAEWRRLTTAGLVAHLSTLDGVAAARFVSEKIPPGSLQESAAAGVVAAWSERDPAAAAQWVQSFPTPGLQAAGAGVLVGNWLERDAKAASAWASRLPAGPVADAAADRAAQFFAARDPAEGLTWAGRVLDPARRAEATKFVLSEWVRADPGAVRAVLRDRPELAAFAPK